MSSTSPWRTSTTAAPRREARKPTASASASIKPSCRSSIRWRSANASTPASISCRLTSMPGSPGTTNSDHIRGAGATAKRQCKPSLTPSHSPGRNHWPHDVGQTQPFRHQTGQLSDQVSASTREAQEVELAFRDLADLCLVLVHCQLQLTHDFAQAMQHRFGGGPPAQDHGVIGIDDKASAATSLKAELLPPQHKPAHVDVRQ